MVAIGVLKEAGDLKEGIPEDTVFIGALSLDGAVENVLIKLENYRSSFLVK